MEFAVGIWNPDPSDQAIDALCAEGVTAIEFGPPFLLQQEKSALVQAAEHYRAAIDLALAMQESGEPQTADRLLEAAAAFIESRPRLGLGSGYGISDVQILALQGEPEAALRALEDAVSAGWRSLWWYYLLQDPNLESLREDPAFQRALREIELDVAAQMDRIYRLEREEESTAEQYPGRDPF
mgnify:CR=1 FL=1